MENSIITILENAKIEYENGSYKEKETFLDHIGYSRDQYVSITNLEEDLIDKLMFSFKKASRKYTSEKKPIHTSQVFFDGILSEEGIKYLRLIDEHVSSNFIKYYMILNIFEKFEARMMTMAVPMMPPPYEE